MRRISSELAPCPICWGELHTLFRLGGRWWLKCGVCGAEIERAARLDKVSRGELLAPGRGAV